MHASRLDSGTWLHPLAGSATVDWQVRYARVGQPTTNGLRLRVELSVGDFAVTELKLSEAASAPST